MCRTPQFNARLTFLDQLRLLNHHHRVGSTRNDAACGDRSTRAGHDGDDRSM